MAAENEQGHTTRPNTLLFFPEQFQYAGSLTTRITFPSRLPTLAGWRREVGMEPAGECFNNYLTTLRAVRVSPALPPDGIPRGRAGVSRKVVSRRIGRRLPV